MSVSPMLLSMAMLRICSGAGEKPWAASVVAGLVTACDPSQSPTAISDQRAGGVQGEHLQPAWIWEMYSLFQSHGWFGMYSLDLSMVLVSNASRRGSRVAGRPLVFSVCVHSGSWAPFCCFLLRCPTTKVFLSMKGRGNGEAARCRGCWLGMYINR